MKLYEINTIEFSGFGRIIRGLDQMSGLPGYCVTESPPAPDSASEYWSCAQPVALEPLEGTGVVYLRRDGGPAKLFLLDKPVLLNAGVWFCVLAYFSEFRYRMAAPSGRRIAAAQELLTAGGIFPNLVLRRVNTVIYQEHAGDFRFKGERHPYWEMTYVDAGKLVNTVDGTDFTLGRGDMQFFAPWQFHSQRAVSADPVAFFTITFELENGDLPGVADKILRADPGIHRQIEMILAEYRDERLYSGEMILASLMQILILTVRMLQRPVPAVRIPSGAAQTVRNETVKRCLDLIEERLGSRLTLDLLARELCVSPSHLGKLFRSETGSGLSSHIRKRRLEQARYLIRTGRYTITQAADQAGFCSVTYFSTEFKKQYGLTPSDYSRSVNRNDHESGGERR